MIWVGLLIAVYCLILVIVARAFVYPYRTPIWTSPGHLGLPQEDVAAETADGIRVFGWWVPHSQPKCVVILVHGFMMNRAEFAPNVLRLADWGCACLIPDLRAHGRSGSKRSGLGWHERLDIRTWVEESKRRYPGVPIVLCGSSMGAAAISFAVSENPEGVDAIILDGAYGELLDAVEGWWAWLAGPVIKLLLKPIPLVAWPMVGFNPFKLSVTRALTTVKTPALLLHGKADKLALPKAAEANYAALQGPKEIVWFERSGHAEARWVHPNEYDEAIRAFLSRQKLL